MYSRIEPSSMRLAFSSWPAMTPALPQPVEGLGAALAPSFAAAGVGFATTGGMAAGEPAAPLGGGDTETGGGAGGVPGAAAPPTPIMPARGGVLGVGLRVPPPCMGAIAGIDM